MIWQDWCLFFLAFPILCLQIFVLIRLFSIEEDLQDYFDEKENADV